MNQLIDFSKFYWSKVLKLWWPIVFLVIPSLDGSISGATSAYAPQDLDNIIKVLGWLHPLWKWLAVFIILVAHVWIMYKLWSGGDGGSIPTGLSDNYENILKKVQDLIPAKSKDFQKVFSNGYRCLEGGRDIKTAITIHFNAYKIVRDFLIQSFDNPTGSAIEVTVEMSEARKSFEGNFSELSTYNSAVGQNKSLSIDLHGLRQLTEKINDNLNALMANFQPWINLNYTNK